jgi:hypothetical protein
MRYFTVVAALMAFLFLLGCWQGEESYIETPEAETPEVHEPEALAPHHSPDQSVDPDRKAKIEEEQRKEEEEQAAQDERGKLGKLLDSLGDALGMENNVEKAKQVAAEIAVLYEKFRREDEGSNLATAQAMNRFKEQMDKLNFYLDRNDIENATTCLVNLGYSWQEWRLSKAAE